jgi:ABC-type molybdate transport system substrate-binding protein
MPKVERPRKSRILMLTLIRGVHTVIYIILAASVCLLLFAALTAYSGPLVITAAMAVAIEVTVFTANGFQCPLTNLAREYGAEEGKGYAFDTVNARQLLS